MLHLLWTPEELAPSLYALWYFFPAMLVNFVLYLAGKLFGQESILPMDLRYEWDGRRLIGDSRGLSSLAWGLLVAVFCSWGQGRGSETLTLVVGALVGMMVSSLAKRRRGLARGTPFVPWDHLDFVLGAALFQACEGGLSLTMAVSGIVLCGLTHRLLGGAIKAVLGQR